MLSSSFFKRTQALAFLLALWCAGCSTHASPARNSMNAPRIAVLPAENLSGKPAPLKELRQALVRKVSGLRTAVLGEQELEQFMTRHRLRYTGGIDTVMAQALKEEARADAVLITALELYEESAPPKIALSSRLVTTEAMPRILWMETVAMSGDDTRKAFGLGIIENPRTLQDKAVSALLDSLALFLDGEAAGQKGENSTFRSKLSFRSPVAGRDLQEISVTFTRSSSFGEETGKTVLIEAALSDLSSKPVTVHYAVTGGTAVRGDNYEIRDGALTFDPGELVKTFELDIRHDGVNTDCRTVEMSLKNPENAVLGGTTTHIHTIIDVDPEPSVTFTEALQRIRENAGTVTITAELSALSGKDVVVPLLFSGTAASPGNYRVAPGPLVIKAGTRRTAITVDITDNGINEDEKLVTVSMGVPTNAAQGKITSASVAIEDVDPLPAISFAASTSSGKDTEPGRIAVTLGAVSGKPVTVAYAATGGTAIRGRDYAIQDGVLAFAPGEQSKSIELAVRSRMLYDDDQTIEVSLKSPQNAVLGPVPAHTYTIVNTTPPPAVSFAASSQRLRTSVGQVAITVQLSAASGKDVVVPFTIAGTAVQDRHFMVKPVPLLIKAGSRFADITILLRRDAPVDADRTIELEMEKPIGAIAGTPSTFRLVLIKDVKPLLAIVPFFNKSNSRNAGEIMALHFAEQFMKNGTFEVMEPGVVRQKLLTYRLIMQDGLSLAAADLISGSLDADLLLVGSILEYQGGAGPLGNPRVEFAVRVLDARSRKVTWSSWSHNQGDDDVVLFDWGRMSSVAALASNMTNAVVRSMATEN